MRNKHNGGSWKITIKLRGITAQLCSNRTQAHGRERYHRNLLFITKQITVAFIYTLRHMASCSKSDVRFWCAFLKVLRSEWIFTDSRLNQTTVKDCVDTGRVMLKWFGFFIRVLLYTPTTDIFRFSFEDFFACLPWYKADCSLFILLAAVDVVCLLSVLVLFRCHFVYAF